MTDSERGVAPRDEHREQTDALERLKIRAGGYCPPPSFPSRDDLHDVIEDTVDAFTNGELTDAETNGEDCTLPEVLANVLTRKYGGGYCPPPTPTLPDGLTADALREMADYLAGKYDMRVSSDTNYWMRGALSAKARAWADEIGVRELLVTPPSEMEKFEGVGNYTGEEIAAALNESGPVTPPPAPETKKDTE